MTISSGPPHRLLDVLSKSGPERWSSSRKVRKSSQTRHRDLEVGEWTDAWGLGNVWGCGPRGPFDGYTLRVEVADCGVSCGSYRIS